MTRASIVQTNFTTGEMSPRLLARVDIAQYANGCEKLENFIVAPHGGAIKRPGFRYIYETKTTEYTRLIPFRFSTIQAYVIEMGDSYFRFFMNGGIIMDPDDPSVPYEIPHFYTQAQLPDVKYTQSADVLFLFHPDISPKMLGRLAHNHWFIEDMNFLDGPYLDVNTKPDWTMQLSDYGLGERTLTASGIGNIFTLDEGLRHIRIGPDTNWSWGRILSIQDDTHATVLMESDGWGGEYPETPPEATTTWRWGSWSPGRGWPSVGAFFEERMWFANTYYEPQTIWGSRSADFNSFSPSDWEGKVLADSGINYTLGTDDVNYIRWLVPGKVLALFTDGAEFSVSGSSLSEPVTPLNVRIQRETARGACDIRPIMVDKEILFWQRARRKLREYFYDIQSEGFRSNDISIFSEHITYPGMWDCCYQQEPFSVIWAVSEQGKLMACTYSKEQNVIAWARHPLGGEGLVTSVASIPADTADELYIVALRTRKDGVVVQSVELLDPEFTPANDQDKDYAFFIDSGLSYTGDPKSTFSGLEHLSGEEVHILADGGIRPPAIVGADGTLTLTRPASVLSVGLPYTARIKSLRYEAGNNEGTAQTKTGRIQKVGVRMYNTLGVRYGSSEARMYEILFRKGSDRMDKSPPLFTGDQLVEFPGDYDMNRQVLIESYQPYPATILGLIPWMVVYN
jgi:hypothetical protein